MKIEAVVTCVDYADFLAETLPHNRSLFDNLVVVTSPEDKATQRICEYWHVECLRTDAFRSRWGEFCKGAAINDGLARLSKTDWLIQMDADILLPPLTRTLLENAALDPGLIYGVDRHMVQGYAPWRKFMALPGLQQENQIFVHPNHFPIGVRVAPQVHGGWLPIGFFQMWHASSGRLTYPDTHNGAARTDMQFAAQWPRNRRAMIPEVIAYHLESDANAPMGANWNGRQTPRFAADSQVPAYGA
jgi:hypothetical protein